MNSRHYLQRAVIGGWSIASIALFFCLQPGNTQAAISVGEALNATNLTWTGNFGTYGWNVVTNVTHDGTAALGYARNATVDASVSTVVTGPTAVGFWWNVRCCTNGGSWLKFLVGTNVQTAICGISAWQHRSFFVPDGAQAISWRYTSSCITADVDGLVNCAWLDEVTLEAPSQPAILSQPQNFTNAAGELLTISPEVTGTEPLWFRWLLEGQPVANETNGVLVITNTQVFAAGEYALIVSSPVGSTTGVVAHLSVMERAPVFTLQPVAPPTPIGSNVTLRAAAAGSDPIFWLWYFNGNAVDRATNSVLAITNAQLAHQGDYTAVASNYLGTATSQVATLTVVLAPIFLTEPVSQGAPLGGSAAFQTTALGPAPITWQWFFKDLPFPAPPSNTLFLSNVGLADYGPYRAAATSPYGTSLGSPAYLAYSPVWFWPTDPYNPVPVDATNIGSICGGDEHIVALRRDHSLLTWGYNYDGQLDVPSTLSNVVAAAAAGSHSVALTADGSVIPWGKVYSIRWTNGTFYLLKSPGDITVPAAATNIVAVTGGGGGADHILVLRADGVPLCWGSTNFALPQPPASATNIIAVASGSAHNLALRVDGTVVGWGYDAYGQADPPLSATNVVAIAGGDGFSLALRANGSVLAWGSNAFGILSVPPAASNVTAIACGAGHAIALRRDGTAISWGDTSFGATAVPAAATNLSAVSANFWNGMALTAEGPPFLVQQPLSSACAAGDTVRFIPAATGALPMSYQWFEDGQPLAGQTSQWLLLPDVQATTGEAYQVVVTNALGSVTSQVARITAVYPSAVRILSIPQLVIAPSNGVARINVAAAGTDPLVYQWRLAGMPITDAGRTSGTADSTLVITNFQASDAGLYSVLVTNSLGAITSPAVNVRLATPGESVAEAVDALDHTWTVSGNWFWEPNITHDGSDAAQLGPISLAGSHTISTTNSGPAAVSFWWKISSVTNQDLLRFAVDASSLISISGEVDWERRSVAIPFGRRTLAWVFTKTGTNSNGQNAAWVDQVSFGAPEPPNVLKQPVGGLAVEGSNFTFSVSASGTELFSYRWRRNGSDMGATSSTYAISNVNTNTSPGNYDVVVSNLGGSITSAPARLTVLPAAALGQPWVGRATGGELQITWILGTLETADQPTGPWIEVTNAVSPFLVTIESSSRFFRVRLP